MMEQAAHDRNLFQSTPGSRMIDLKFPECVGLVFLCESCFSAMDGLTEWDVDVGSLIPALRTMSPQAIVPI